MNHYVWYQDRSQNCKGLVETLGKYSRSVDAGLQFYVPIFQKIRTVELAMHPLRLQNILLSRKITAEIEQASL